MLVLKLKVVARSSDAGSVESWSLDGELRDLIVRVGGNESDELSLGLLVVSLGLSLCLFSLLLGIEGGIEAGEDVWVSSELAGEVELHLRDLRSRTRVHDVV